MNIRLRSPIPFLALALLLGTPTFLGTSCNRALDPAGAYDGDKLLFAADGVIVDVNRICNDVQGLAARNPSVAAQPRYATLLALVGKQRDGVVERTPSGAIDSSEVLALLISARDGYRVTKSASALETLNDKLNLARSFLKDLGALAEQFAHEPPSR
jgi:hypothetical protein